MTVFLPARTRTYIPGESLVGKAGYAVKLSTTGGDPPRSVRLAASAVGFVGVVLLEGVVPGTAVGLTLNVAYPSGATIQCDGVAKAVAAAAITQGAPVTVDTDGRFRIATTGETIVGRAEEPAIAANHSFALALTQGAVV